MNTLIFEEPPAASRGIGGTPKHQDIVAQLTKRPGEWCRVYESTTRNAVDSFAYQIRNGRNKAYAPGGTFEAVGRTIRTESSVIHRTYARYIGPDGDHA